jgi:hypothetical protein
VIYDATTDPNFIDKKKQQIKNYANQLKEEKIHFPRCSYSLADLQKQVWIITQQGKEVNPIKRDDHINIKEIPYRKLIELYHQRLQKEIDTVDLADLLRDLK